ncbi:MAG: transcriptional repressor [Candidatus Bipolaricaulis sp.]|nr:transcriptional repressor [Candidatus Bipolaricaulis sp.]
MKRDKGPDGLESRLEELRRTFRRLGVRLTPQRLEVFREVAGRRDHPDAESVFRGVHDRMPSISLDTVHRTLLLLRDLGLIVALGPRRESVRFDAHLETHDHYVCLRCGMTRDIAGEATKVVRPAASVGDLGSVVATRVEVQGICRECAREQREAKGEPRRRGAR